MTLELVASTVGEDDNDGTIFFTNPTAGNLLVVVAVDYKSEFIFGTNGDSYAGLIWRAFDDGHNLDWNGFTGQDDGGTSFSIWARVSTGEEENVYIDRVPDELTSGWSSVPAQRITAWGGEFSGFRGSTGSRDQLLSSATTPSFANDFLNQLVLHLWVYNNAVEAEDPVIDASSQSVTEDTYNGTLVGDLQVVRNDGNDHPFLLAVQATTYDTNGTKPGLSLSPAIVFEYEEELIPGGIGPRGSLVMPPPGYTARAVPGVVIGDSPVDPFDDDAQYMTVQPTVTYPPGFDDDWATQTTLVGGSISPDAAVIAPRTPTYNDPDYIGINWLDFNAGLVSTFNISTGDAEVGYWQVCTILMHGGSVGGFIGQDALQVANSDGWVTCFYDTSGGAPEGYPELFVLARRTTSATNETATFSWPDSPGTRLAAASITNWGDYTHTQQLGNISSAAYSDTGVQTNHLVNTGTPTNIDKGAAIFRYIAVIYTGTDFNGTAFDWYPWVSTTGGFAVDGTTHIFTAMGIDIQPDLGAVDDHVVNVVYGEAGNIYTFTFAPPTDPTSSAGEEPDDLLAHDDGVDYYQVQLSKDPTFTNVLRTQRVEKGTSKAFRVKKPGTTAALHARVRAVDERGNKSGWTINNSTMINPRTPIIPSLSFDFNEDNTNLRGKVVSEIIADFVEDDISRYEFQLEPTQWTRLVNDITATQTHIHVDGPNSDYANNGDWKSDIPPRPFTAWFGTTQEEVQVTLIEPDSQGHPGRKWTITRGINGIQLPVSANRRVFYFAKDSKGRKNTVHSTDDTGTNTFAIFPSIPVGRYYKAKVRAISRDSRQSDWSAYTAILRSADGATTGDVGGGGGGSGGGGDVAVPQYPFERILRYKHPADGSLGEAFTTDAGTIMAFRVTTSEPVLGPSTFRLLIDGTEVGKAIIEDNGTDSQMAYLESYAYGAAAQFQIDQFGGAGGAGDATDGVSMMTAYVYVVLDEVTSGG